MTYGLCCHLVVMPSLLCNQCSMIIKACGQNIDLKWLKLELLKKRFYNKLPTLCPYRLRRVLIFALFWLLFLAYALCFSIKLKFKVEIL